MTPRSRARRPCPTCASGRSRSARLTWSGKPASSAVITSRCWTGSTCSAWRHPGRPCCSTACSHRMRSGTRCPARSRRRSWPSGSRCTPSTPPGSPATPAWPGGPTPCCRPVSSRSRACCPGRKRSRRSSRRSPRPTRADDTTRTHAAVDATLAGLHRIEVPGQVTSDRELPAVVPAGAPEFVRDVTAVMMAGHGDDLPVRALPADGTYPSGTAAYEKRNVSELVAQWDPDLCIQCGNCSFVCPHSVIRSTYYDESLLAGAPSAFLSAPLDARGLPDTRFTLQVYVEDCTGCELCVQACPVTAPVVGPAVGAPGEPARKAINLAAREPLVAAERDNIAFFETLPVADRSRVDFGTVRGTQFLLPLFEFSGACAGCGEKH